MMPLFSGWAEWHWLVFGLLLLACELLGTAGYLLWIGVAALLVSAILWLWPLGFVGQWILFAILALLASLLWWRWQHTRDRQDQDHTSLNQRRNTLIGRQATLSEATENGVGRLNLGDTTWRVQVEQDLPAGTAVEVVDVQGITLLVRPIDIG
ncbi:MULTISPECIES: NfeD family protein [Plesiomonas]|uniref:NfeD-like C-terminal domain-containing protein n=3 Tax=Plesiomonas shigelloides TaxID=703 RepID=R8APD1_PLESH|nr:MULTISPECIES: NfeD family protein [Plesiomonas]MDO4688560.1 NfeD family protein [Plesiomonas sp.]AVQ86090.1 DUF4131 domain-containing protein [Plesiomonas shigelloides]EON88189.1 hypothetical protein PLESHI_11305 [Plesiomonas shigelloides 302-73]PVU65405.1 DUF4131 domain-containing protein [Plesiomonas shigelloides]QIY07883.1 NfeD family protein [Plesiomonas shigelloides]